MLHKSGTVAQLFESGKHEFRKSLVSVIILSTFLMQKIFFALIFFYNINNI